MVECCSPVGKDGGERERDRESREGEGGKWVSCEIGGGEKKGFTQTDVDVT